ncbi:hypothetical protein [Pigmentiphaga litoralis]|uniref:Uncharacterized protein n=1 Tax=Pigmentiphaga litoralis TaxID=516702 RepID=A0A7Y9IUJ3_9BURK|nr:hypothetical protein [Pigmentiphaga litoralis]NYE23187.1 hypothetical protein [Pigmentiphaga litoralis]NYE83199.1 hypothetical protein [Pigmentiphaga litoralis]
MNIIHVDDDKHELDAAQQGLHTPFIPPKATPKGDDDERFAHCG